MRIIAIVAGCVLFGLLMGARDFAGGVLGRAATAAVAFMVLGLVISVARSVARDRHAR